MKPNSMILRSLALATVWLFSHGTAMAQSGEAPQAAETTAANAVESLQVSRQAGAVLVKVGLKQAPPAPPTSFSVTNPARVVFDFPSTINALGRNVQEVNEGDLRSINVIQSGDRTRLVLNLKRSGSFEARQEDGSFMITLQPAVIDDATSRDVQHFSALESKDGKPAIRNIGFRRGKGGEGMVTVDLSDPGAGVDVRQQGSNLIVDFQKATLPEQLLRRMDVNDFATPVSTVSTKIQGDGVRMTITPKGLWEHTAYQSDNQFVVEVKPLREDAGKVFQGTRQGYQGEKVSLNFQNIPLRELLHVFADITNFNIVVSDTVAGNVSLRLNDVPWDQALEIVLQQKNLAMRKNGNVIWIAPADELAAKEKLELESRAQIADLEPTRTESFQLNYQKAEAVQKLLTDKGQPVLSKRGSAVVDARTNKLFITDAPSRLDEVRRLIAEVDVAVRQVLIEARIVEADTTFSRNIGVRLGGHDHPGMDYGHSLLGTTTRFGISGSTRDAYSHLPFTATSTGFATSPGAGAPGGLITSYTPPTLGQPGKISYKTEAPDPSGTIDPSQFVNLAAAKAAGSFALTLFNSAKTQLLTLELTAMEADGRGKTISSPRVLTADKIEALIEDGKEVPYWMSSASGATSVGYRKATLSLKVRPQITPDGQVIMTLEVNKDNVDPSISTTYGIAINTKHVKTEVLVENGGTVVIGGIFIQEERNTVTRVPVLGDLPLLGAMFRNTEKADNRRELLVFITPKIVSDTLSLR